MLGLDVRLGCARKLALALLQHGALVLELECELRQAGVSLVELLRRLARGALERGANVCNLLLAACEVGERRGHLPALPCQALRQLEQLVAREVGAACARVAKAVAEPRVEVVRRQVILPLGTVVGHGISFSLL